MIKLSLKGFAKYMTANSAQQRKILKDYKYPEPEGQAMATYYREARDFIQTYHKNDQPPDWLIGKAQNLSAIAISSSGGTKTRLQNNARAVRQYTKNFSNRKFDILTDISLPLSLGSVQITVSPDLHVIEKGKERIIKLEFAINEPNPKLARIICQAMFEVQQTAGMGMSSSSICFLDVPRAKEYKGARLRSRLLKEMDAACKNIAAIWDGI